jgi:hypothetical protein
VFGKLQTIEICKTFQVRACPERRC